MSTLIVQALRQIIPGGDWRDQSAVSRKPICIDAVPLAQLLLESNAECPTRKPPITADERWNEFADVILANPPLMSPKGGIKPHKRFSIQAKRSEVLFVDYIVTRNGVGAAGSMPKINQGIVERIPIPLPPLSTQQAIVTEIEAEQTLVAANRKLISRFEQKIQATLARVWGDDVSAAKSSECPQPH